MKYLLNDIIEPDMATGKVTECYQKLNDMVGMIHDEFKIFSVSPAMFASQISGMEYLGSHATLKPIFWTLLRYIISVKYNNKFCMIFNRPIMEKEGIPDGVIKQMVNDYELIPLEKPERKLMQFVMKLIDSPAEINEEDIKELKDLDWDECTIFEASLVGARHIAIDIIFTGFIRYQ